MRIMDNKKLRFSKVMFNGAFIYNPILTQAIGICTVVAVGVTLKLSLAFSLILSVLLIISEILASLILKKLSRWLRIAAYMLISVALLLPVMLYADKNMSELSASLGIYLPLLSVNSIIVIRCEVFAVKNSVRNSFFDAVAASTGFTVTALITGIIRELLASGTVLGKSVSRLPTLSGMALPFGGLLVIGFIAAFQKWLIQKRFPRYPTNTFNLRTASDKPVLKNEGINATDGSLSLISDPAVSSQEEETPKDASDENEDKSEEISDLNYGDILSFILDESDEGDTFSQSENTSTKNNGEEEDDK